jgi:Glycosyl hydrolases family 39
MPKLLILTLGVLEWIAACLAANAQTLTNAGFETFAPSGIASNWTQQAASGASVVFAQETNNPYSGASCQRAVVSGLNEYNLALLYQPFPIQTGCVYSAGIWLRAAGNSVVQFELRASNGRGFQAAASQVASVGASWQQFVITGGWQFAGTAQFAVNFLSNGTNWIDDATLADVTSNYLYAPLVNTTSSIPQSLFGLHIIKLASAPDDWSPLPQGIIRFWDTNVRWNQLQPNSNTWNWTHFDACTNVVLSNEPGCKILYTLGQTPPWAALNTNTPQAAYGPGASSEPANMSAWSNYVYSVAARYKGVIEYYEIWNEADAPNFYSGAISNMVTMAQIARNVLTNVDPNIKIVGPAVTLGGLGWLEKYIQAGGPPPDIVSFHNYMASQPEASLGEIVGLRDVLSRHPQWSSLPVWCTEGAPAEGASDQENMGIAARAYLFWWTQNVQNYCWATWDSTLANVQLSLNPPSSTPSPAGIAYSNTANWLVGAQMTDKTIDSNGTWVVELHRLGFSAAHILWNPDVTTNYAIPAGWNVYEQRDLSNNVTSLTGVSNVTVGVAPVILDSVPSLAISLDADHSSLTVAWPGSATGFNLYTTTNLAPANWQPVTNAVASENGNLEAFLPLDKTRFFRLGRLN